MGGTRGERVARGPRVPREFFRCSAKLYPLAIVLKAMNVTLGSKVNQDIMMAEIIVKRYCFRWTLIPS